MRFEIESWIWYAFAVGMIIARLYVSQDLRFIETIEQSLTLITTSISRTILFRTPKGLQYDDWIMGIFVTTCYTALITTSNIEAKTQSNLLPPTFDITTLTPQQLSARAYGSKIVVVVEQLQIAVIWSCKACLLILYHRLTESVAPTSHRAIRLLAAYVALSLIVMQILYFTTWCRPFRAYWTVPAPSPQCTTLTSHRITNTVFNISSDLAMLAIALPLSLRSLLPLKRKLILSLLFSLCLFAILAAVLNKYYSFTSPYAPSWIAWYARESSTAILVANLPFTWTLLRKMFNLGAFDAQHPPPPTYHSSRTAGGRQTARTLRANQASPVPGVEEKVGGSKGSKSLSLIGSVCASSRGREERREAQEVRSSETTTTTQSDAGLLSEAIQAVDFAGGRLDGDTGDVDIDVEKAIDAISPVAALYHQHAQHLAPRPASPALSRRTTGSVQVAADGTGGYVTVPRRVHLHHRNDVSRASSVASSIRRPMSAQGVRDDASTVSASVGAGGGRSAADRRKRARLSG